MWDSLKYRARSFPDYIAVEDGTSTLTFAELYATAEQTAIAFRKAGIASGDTIALSLSNTLWFAPAFLALCRLQTRITLVSPRYGSSELQSIVAGLRVKTIVTLASRAGELRSSLCGSIPTATLSCNIPGLPLALVPCKTSQAATGPTLTAEQEVLLAHASVIKTTSGSTGAPKSVALETAALLTEAENVAHSLSLSPGNRILAPVPLFHSYGFDLGLLAGLYSGAKLQIFEAIIPRKILAACAQRDTTVFLGVPSIYQLLLDTLAGGNASLSHIAYALSCTAPLAPRVIHAFYDRFRVPLCQHYGSSETGAIATHIPSQVLKRPDSAGLAINNVSVRIAAENGEELPSGAEGEVVVRSGALASGYITGAPSNRNPFQGKWYRTGDRGVMDTEGFLFLNGRLDDLINVGGLKVSPHEVVRVLESLPPVKEAAVIGVADDDAGQVVYAAVTLKSPATESELIRACNGKLADFKIPRRIEIMSELPRGASGKVKLQQKDIKFP